MNEVDITRQVQYITRIHVWTFSQSSALDLAKVTVPYILMKRMAQQDSQIEAQRAKSIGIRDLYGFVMLPSCRQDNEVIHSI